MTDETVASASPAPTPKQKVWDAPVRLVHWLLVFLVALSWWTAEEGCRTAASLSRCLWAERIAQPEELGTALALPLLDERGNQGAIVICGSGIAMDMGALADTQARGMAVFAIALGLASLPVALLGAADLLANAMKFSPENQPVEVAFSRPDDSRLAISICDRGPGIGPGGGDAAREGVEDAKGHRLHLSTPVGG